MKNREIKFKIFDTHNKIFLNQDQFNVRCDGYNGGIQNNKCAGVVGGVIALQFTGLKDKNGNDVYESDIIRFSDENLKVIYNSSTASFDVEFIGGDVEPLVPQYGEWYADQVEIIGNIYSNPELLK